jgi:hypothetical protein
MKKQGLTTPLVASLMLALTIVTTFAGTSAKAVSTIPFAFTAGDVTVPAGIYTVSETNTPRILLIRNPHRPVAYVSTLCLDSGKGLAEPKLVFHRYGDRYFLALISLGGDGRYTMPTSRAEREILNGKSNSRAGNEMKPERIYIDAQ